MHPPSDALEIHLQQRGAQLVGIPAVCRNQRQQQLCRIVAVRRGEPRTLSKTLRVACRETRDQRIAGFEIDVRRSEERRVGKECRSRWSPHHEKKGELQWRRGGGRGGGAPWRGGCAARLPSN